MLQTYYVDGSDVIFNVVIVCYYLCLGHRYMRPAKSGGGASRGYSAPTVLCFCALSFIVGRFLREIPNLPAVPSGVRTFTQI